MTSVVNFIVDALRGDFFPQSKSWLTAPGEITSIGGSVLFFFS